MHKTPDELIRLVLTGQASREEHEQLSAWLAESAENQRVFELLQQVWLEEAASPRLPNADYIRERIWREGMADEAKSLRGGYGYLVKAAAVILLVVALPLLVFIYRNSADAPAPVAVQWIEQVNPAGQKRKLVLPDSSVVWLNADSRIRYAAGFAGPERMVELSGEAYFEVKKNAGKPFIVTAGPLATTAIGTAFNIAAYPEDSVVQVALLSGKVSVAPAGQTGGEEFLLEQGDGVRFSRQQNEVRKYTFEEWRVMAWRQGVLLFEGDAFAEVRKKLSRWYGVTVQVSGTPPEDWKLNGRFRNESLVNVLENIRFGRNFSYELARDTLTIDFTGSRQE